MLELVKKVDLTVPQCIHSGNGFDGGKRREALWVEKVSVCLFIIENLTDHYYDLVVQEPITFLVQKDDFNFEVGESTVINKFTDSKCLILQNSPRLSISLEF